MQSGQDYHHARFCFTYFFPSKSEWKQLWRGKRQLFWGLFCKMSVVFMCFGSAALCSVNPWGDYGCVVMQTAADYQMKRICGDNLLLAHFSLASGHSVQSRSVLPFVLYYPSPLLWHPSVSFFLPVIVPNPPFLYVSYQHASVFLCFYVCCPLVFQIIWHAIFWPVSD